jgi:hypothetical protein
MATAPLTAMPILPAEDAATPKERKTMIMGTISGEATGTGAITAGEGVESISRNGIFEISRLLFLDSSTRHRAGKRRKRRNLLLFISIYAKSLIMIQPALSAAHLHQNIFGFLFGELFSAYRHGRHRLVLVLLSTQPLGGIGSSIQKSLGDAIDVFSATVTLRLRGA